ncbi:redoxin domain-containing protein [Haloparvum sedimenti]|uniref:redoxin domain-containing protein n=1 Tax=Haloparvum sedimenti TaxID=1678448 RepID=UPI00071E8A83|nr:redoxin domain-containing protein [Haloparvum sedimenti]
MVDVGDDAPVFEASIATDEVAPFDLADHLGDGVVVLAFFPAAFTGTCTAELCTFRDRLSRFEELDATVFGVSTDLPFALREFRAQEALPFGLVGDPDHDAVAAYDVADDSFEGTGVETVARRSVFVVGPEEEVQYRWLADDPGQEPPYETVEEAVASATVDAA